MLWKQNKANYADRKSERNGVNKVASECVCVWGREVKCSKGISTGILLRLVAALCEIRGNGLPHASLESTTKNYVGILVVRLV